MHYTRATITGNSCTPDKLKTYVLLLFLAAFAITRPNKPVPPPLLVPCGAELLRLLLDDTSDKCETSLPSLRRLRGLLRKEVIELGASSAACLLALPSTEAQFAA